MGRTFRITLLLAVLIFIMSLPVLAAPEDYVVSEEGHLTDTSYSGPLDPLTGLPLEGELSSGSGSYIPLDGDRFGYDKNKLCYVNHVGNLTFTSNIPNGAIVSKNQTVSLDLPTGLTGILYRNGDAVTDADLTNINQTGNYLLEVGSHAASDTFAFQIVGDMNNSLRELQLPPGFTFDYVNLNSETLTTTFTNYTELLEDGAYEVRWSCREIGISYNLNFTLDTVAPTLTLPEVTNGEAHSKVTFADLEQGAYVVAEEKKTGEVKTLNQASAEIKDAGTYHLTVYDQAGNSTSYDFTIHVYLNLSAFAALALLLAGVLGLWFYSRYIKKHPRVG